MHFSFALKIGCAFLKVIILLNDPNVVVLIARKRIKLFLRIEIYDSPEWRHCSFTDKKPALCCGINHCALADLNYFRLDGSQ